MIREEVVLILALAYLLALEILSEKVFDCMDFRSELTVIVIAFVAFRLGVRNCFQ